MFPRHAIILAVVMSAYAATAGAVPPPAVQYGANCQAPTFATDMLVCADPDLLQLDADVHALFDRLRQDSPEAAPQLEASQWDWFQRRSECALRADHRQCVLDAYLARLATLQSPGSGAPASLETPMPTAPYAFWLVALAAAVIGALLRRLARRQGKRLLGIAGGLWLGYALWEVAVQVWSPEANIRVDLLLWYPALLICTLAGLLRKASPPR